MNMIEFQEQWRNRMNGILSDIFSSNGGMMMDTSPPNHMQQSNGHPQISPGIHYPPHHNGNPHASPPSMVYPGTQSHGGLTGPISGSNSLIQQPYYQWEYTSRCAYCEVAGLLYLIIIIGFRNVECSAVKRSVYLTSRTHLIIALMNNHTLELGIISMTKRF